MSNETKNLVRISEATKRFPISKNTIRRRINDGSLVAYRFGPRIIAVDLDELEALFKPVVTVNPDTWGA
jgi:excisionase family DNA binding protein